MLLPAVFVCLLTAAQANAGFIYSVNSTPSSVTFGGSTVSITGFPGSGTQSTPTDDVLFRVADASTTSPSATDTDSIMLTEAVSITNVPPLGTAATGVIDVTGTLQFIRSDSGGEVSFFTASAPSFSGIIGGVTYTISNFAYTGPTVNGSSTATSALIDSSVAAPEPASLATMGLGMAGLCLSVLRRRRSR